MTDAPPPATMSHTRPVGLRTVNLSEAPVASSSAEIVSSAGVSTRPNGSGNSSSTPPTFHLAASRYLAVSSSSTRISSGKGWPAASSVLARGKRDSSPAGYSQDRQRPQRPPK
ncbi:hypothetical protein Vretimale_7588 [Volvox reticuliferus]|uniref:Uncharacterized protein n=1 Tax=Volvox reticuliferus TaxID=1737510 RepID=A0A8J4G9J6_9CHLO|nr:hypothetical protein Vretifemale_7648 [Volvox reticuliferus]GIM02731.1 hypothetical protein Vretimale_7588 [Volvox reticuliferus]